MICPKCGKEIADGSAFCAFCGSPVGEDIHEEKKEELEKVEDVVNNTDEVNVDSDKIEDVQEEKVINEEDEMLNMDSEKKEETVTNETEVEKVKKEEEKTTTTTTTVVNETNTQKKKRHSVITFAVLIIVALLVLGVAGFLMFSLNAEKLYKGIIEKGINSFMQSPVFTADSAKIDASVSLKSDAEELSIINNLSAGVNIQYDLNTNEVLGKVKVNNDEESYLDLQLLVNLLEKKLYIGESNIYDKMISIDIPDEALDNIESEDDDGSLIIEKINRNTASKRLTKAINNSLSKDLFANEKATITVNEKEKKVKDYVLKMTSKQLAEVINNTISTLKEDKEFLSCYEDEEKMKELLDDLSSSIEYSESEESTVEFHIYTSGLFNNFEGVTVAVTDELEDRTVVDIRKNDEKTYVVSSRVEEYGNTQDEFSIVVTVNKATEQDIDLDMSFEIEDVGEMTINYALNCVYNQGVDALDIGNSVNYQDLTSDEVNEMYENFQNSSLYSIFSMFIANNEFLGSDEETPANVPLKDGQSFIMTYDDDIVKFNVPSTFDEDYSGNTYKTFSKYTDSGYVSIDVESEMDTVEEYEEYLEDMLDSLKEKEGYKDFSSSKVEEIEVNNVKFYKKSISYTSVIGEYEYVMSTTYYYTKINDDYIFVIEVTDDDNLLTENELNRFLTIEIE